MAFSSQLQSLFLSPDLNSVQSTYQSPARRPHTQRGVVCNQTIEQPLIDEVKQLREELDGQRSIDSGTQQQ